MPDTRIAFFGLGTMGAGMAGRLLAAGHHLTVYNRDRAKAEPFAAQGAHSAETPREAAGRADILIAMLADDVGSRAVWHGENGALASAKTGAIAIECSTLTVPWVRELGAECAKGGLAFLDAPVTGTKPHAAKGELTFLVGGSGEVLEKVRPILALMSKEIVHVGPCGAGATLKLVNNFVCGVQAAALAEANALLLRAGLDVKTALPVLLNGAPGSPLCKTLATRHSTSDPVVYFQLRHMAKDLAYAISEAKPHDIALKTAMAALETFQEAEGEGWGEKDLSAIIGFKEKA